MRYGIALSVQSSQTRLVALINPGTDCGQGSARASSIELLTAALFSENQNPTQIITWAWAATINTDQRQILVRHGPKHCIMYRNQFLQLTWCELIQEWYRDS